MDALRLNLRTKEELHPLLRDLVTSCSRFKGHKDSEGRSRMVSWLVRSWRDHKVPCLIVIRLITLNGMQISERLSEEQARQVELSITAGVQNN
jgi:ESCRT-I complex subunit VPS28